MSKDGTIRRKNACSKLHSRLILKDIDLTKIINTENLTGYVQGIAEMLGGIFNIFVSVVVSIYILNRRKEIINFLRRLLGAIFKEKTHENSHNRTKYN